MPDIISGSALLKGQIDSCKVCGGSGWITSSDDKDKELGKKMKMNDSFRSIKLQCFSVSVSEAERIVIIPIDENGLTKADYPKFILPFHEARTLAEDIMQRMAAFDRSKSPEEDDG